MQHQPNFAAALSVATHRNGPALSAPLPAFYPVRPVHPAGVVLDLGDVYDLPATEYAVVELRC